MIDYCIVITVEFLWIRLLLIYSLVIVWVNFTFWVFVCISVYIVREMGEIMLFVFSLCLCFFVYWLYNSYICKFYICVIDYLRIVYYYVVVVLVFLWSCELFRLLLFVSLVIASVKFCFRSYNCLFHYYYVVIVLYFLRSCDWLLYYYRSVI